MHGVVTVAEKLRSALGGEAVLMDDAILDARSHDAWPVSAVQARLGHHPHRPDLVVLVRTAAEVVKVLRTASEAGVPVTPWGLGSSVTGQPLPTRGGIVLDLSTLVGPAVLDEVDHTVTVPAGVRGSDLERWLHTRGYTMNFSPQSLSRSTVGGWIATRATGHFSSRYGGVEQLVTRYSVVLADGSVAEVGQRPRAAVGPDLRHLFLGSEGALGVVTSVTLRVFLRAQSSHLEAFTLPDVGAGLAVMRTVMQSGVRPHLLRLYDAEEAAHLSLEQHPAPPVLFVGHEGLAEIALAEHRATTSIVTAHGGTSIGAGPVETWMDRRFDFSTVENLLARPGGYAETIEVANLWSRLKPMYDALKEELAPLADEVLGHFSHVYEQGSSLYVILLGHASDDHEALTRLREAWRRSMKVVIAHDGEISHHHGAGLARSPWVRESLGSGFEILRRLKVALDPQHVLNPGKLGLDQTDARGALLRP